MLHFFIAFHRHCHKSTVLAAKWNSNGNWLVTGSRDHLLKLFDIRMMKELQTFRGHKKEATGAVTLIAEAAHKCVLLIFAFAARLYNHLICKHNLNSFPLNSK